MNTEQRIGHRVKSNHQKRHSTSVYHHSSSTDSLSRANLGAAAVLPAATGERHGLDLRSRNLPLSKSSPQEVGGVPRIEKQRAFNEQDEPPMPASDLDMDKGELGSGGELQPKQRHGRISSFDQLDTDLHDRISYLDLKQRERHRQRKLEHMEKMRRIREDADRITSARGGGKGKGVQLELSGGSQSHRSKSPVAREDIGGASERPPNERPGGESQSPSHGGPPMITVDDQPIIGSPSSALAPLPAAEYAPTMDINIRHLWSEAIDLSDIRNIEDQTEFRSLRSQLGIDRISLETLSRYHVRGHMDGYDHAALCYPRYRGPATRGRLPTGLKVIRRVGDKLNKENYPEEANAADGKLGKFSGIFGYHMITPNDNRVVLTTNERDALAVYDATNGIPALSLPNGEKLDRAVLPYLDDFDLIYLWFPQIHERYAKDYASYLNASRCYIITKMERPVELIRDDQAKEVLHGIQEAVRVRYRGFRSLVDIREEVKQEIMQSRTKINGLAQWKRYEVLNHYLRGFRPGEITVLTGGTGFGKTTFLCEYAMDLYTQGVRTLFCSFEVPEEKILKWMIIQFAGPGHVKTMAKSRTYHNGMKIPLYRIDHHHSVELWLDRFERTHSDLIIMKVEDFRNKTIKELAECIKDQVIASGVQHVVIDNLQFFVSLSALYHDTLSREEKASIQDRFVGLLRRICNDYGIHITLVVHPRNSDELESDFDLRRIGGSSRIFQEADNILAIVRHRDENDRRRFRKFLYILKNRYGGRRAESEQIEMIFQPSTYTHALIEYQPRH